MATLTDDDYHDVANATQEDNKVNNLLAKVQRGIVETLPITIITEETKETIWLDSTTATKAAGLIKADLKKSEEPQKMKMFLEKLTKQPIHAQKIREIYNKKLEECKKQKISEQKEAESKTSDQETGETK